MKVDTDHQVLPSRIEDMIIQHQQVVEMPQRDANDSKEQVTLLQQQVSNTNRKLEDQIRLTQAVQKENMELKMVR